VKARDRELRKALAAMQKAADEALRVLQDGRGRKSTIDQARAALNAGVDAFASALNRDLEVQGDTEVEEDDGLARASAEAARLEAVMQRARSKAARARRFVQKVRGE
jgi:hypothetical protein